MILHSNAPVVHSSKKPEFQTSFSDDFTVSARTAIYRSGMSAPVKLLIKHHLLSQGSALNYGKGRFDFDTNAIAAETGHCLGYDYTFNPQVDLLGGNYGFVFCGYVVNTLPPASRQYVWNQMSTCCLSGIVFVAARTDRIAGNEFEDGVLTSIGTFQKSYRKGELLSEALQHFTFVVEIKGGSGFALVACSNEPLPEKVLLAGKS